jgi:hypothetical protein
MSKLRLIVASSLFVLSGCGTYVPSIHDFSIKAGEGPRFVQAIVESIHCELRRAIVGIIDQDKKLAESNGKRTADWFDRWGVQIGLTLQADEKSTVSPSSVFMPDSPLTSVFTLGGGVSWSSGATRKGVLNYYYKVEDLYKMGKCDSSTDNKASGSFLIRSDLKVREWLAAAILSVGSGAATAPTTTKTPLKQNALTHQVKFEVVTSGNITPAWELAEGTINKSGTFLSASRTRTHDLVITFGPAEDGVEGLVGVARDTFIAVQDSVILQRSRTID